MVSIGSIGHDTIPMEKVHVLFVGDFEKVYSVLDEGVESLSDGIHRIHLTRTHSDGKVFVLLVRYLKKFHPCWPSL